MNDAELRAYLEENGYARHLWNLGRKGLCEKYHRFVEEVEQGYEMSLYDYRNELDLRALLRAAGLDGELQEWDARLQARLEHTGIRIWESAAGEPFWDFGIPAGCGEEFREDLRAEGLLP